MYEEFTGGLLSPTGRMSVSVAESVGRRTVLLDGETEKIKGSRNNILNGEKLGLIGVKDGRNDEMEDLVVILEERKQRLELLQRYPPDQIPLDSVAGLTIRLYESLVQEITGDLVHAVRSSLISNSRDLDNMENPVTNSKGLTGNENTDFIGSSERGKSNIISASNSSSSNASMTTSKSATIEVPCSVCGRSVASSRFAPHLEKCMGLGSRGRTARQNK